jgi:hypothetical protein
MEFPVLVLNRHKKYCGIETGYCDSNPLLLVIGSPTAIPV